MRSISKIAPGVSGGTLAYRRSAPDVRDGHRLYGIAKFEVCCDGVVVVASGRSWWEPDDVIQVCKPGADYRGAHICGVLPTPADHPRCGADDLRLSSELRRRPHRRQDRRNR